MSEEFKPHWSDAELAAAEIEVKRILKDEYYKKEFERCNKDVEGYKWWWGGTVKQKIAYAKLGTIKKYIDWTAKDAPRMLRLVREDWKNFLGLVYRFQGEKTEIKIVNLAKSGPARLYLFIYQHMRSRTLSFNALDYASTLNAWTRLTDDIKYLYEYDYRLYKKFTELP